MVQFDLMIRGGSIVTPDGEITADLGIADGVIAAIEPELSGYARSTIDAVGEMVIPGAIDAHVHFNEPGRTEWEGWASGSAAALAGGVTTVIEMPLNAHPPTLDRNAFDAKVAAATHASYADFALWGGLTPTNLDHLADLHDAGVIGFKAFMSRSGTDDFQHAGDDTLYQGMQAAAALGLPVAVHAENDAITADLAVRARAAGRTSMHDYLESRPVVAELEAIGRAITLAEATGCSLHIVHVSTARGVGLVAEARQRGLDVSCETCPHYLVLTDDDAERIGALAKCAPPLRPRAERDRLRQTVTDGQVDLLASDHSPAPPSMKQSDDAFANWGGISGCQHLVPMSVSLGHELGWSWSHLVSLLCEAPARRFGLGKLDTLVQGALASVAVLAPKPPEPISRAAIQYRHPASAWDSVPVTWSVRATVLRGEIVWFDGGLRAERPFGQLVTPAR